MPGPGAVRDGCGPGDVRPVGSVTYVSRTVNLLDVLLLLALVTAAVGGYRLGLIARATSWVGFVAGLFLATATVPAVAGLLTDSDPRLTLVAGLMTLVFTVGLLANIGQVIGLRLRGLVADTPLRPFDRVGGFAAGGLSILVLVWFLVPAAAQVPGAVAQQVRGSSVVSLVRGVAPAPPDPMQAFRALVDDSRFPDVFDDLRPAPDTGPPPSELPVSPEVVAQVTASTGNVETTGCGARYEGSAFTVGDGVMITNAHVVAGADDVRVRTPDGRVLGASVVVFDDDIDLAVLEVPDLGQAPLPLASAATEGTQGVTVGYPGGQDTPRAEPAAIRESRQTIGRDIYGRDTVRRQVLFLAARLQQGDSGSPVVDQQGQVLGAVFAISPDRETTAFALDVSEVRSVLDAPRTPGETGRCP